MDFRDLRRALSHKLDAIEDRKRDHIFFYFEMKGRQYRATKLSHGAKGQISRPLLSVISKRLRLDKAEFEDLVDCPLSKDQYFALWLERS